MYWTLEKWTTLKIKSIVIHSTISNVAYKTCFETGCIVYHLNMLRTGPHIPNCEHCHNKHNVGRNL